MSLKGYPSQEKEDRLTAQHVTVSPSGQFKNALDVRDTSAVFVAGSDAAEAGSTTSVINATGHSALKGDRIRFTSGILQDTGELDVSDVGTDTITLGQTLSNPPGVGDAFDILRPISLTLSSVGGISTTLSFIRDGSSQTVIEDTVTPANNRPLPVKLTGLDGDVVINSTNLNLAVQLSHTGAAPDSTQIGDGTEIMLINASGEAQVSDDTARASLATIAGDTTSIDSSIDVALSTRASESTASTIAGDTTSIDGKTPSLGAAVIASSVPVNIASDQTVPVSASSLPLPTGAATEVTLSTVAGDTTSIDGKTPALGAAVIASSVPVNIASDQTVPVSASSLPLPSGAATEATLSTVAGDTTSIDGKTPALGAAVIASSVPVNIASDQTVPVSASSLPLPTGAATEASLATVAGAVSGTEMQVDVIASLPSGTNTIGAVDLNRLDIVDLIDDLGDGAGIVFAANDNIDDSAGTFLTIVASTAAEIQAMQVIDTTGGFIGLYTGPAASETLKAVIGPGSDQTVELSIPASTRLSVRRMDSATEPLTDGFLSINFLG